MFQVKWREYANQKSTWEIVKKMWSQHWWLKMHPEDNAKFLAGAGEVKMITEEFVRPSEKLEQSKKLMMWTRQWESLWGRSCPLLKFHNVILVLKISCLLSLSMFYFKKSQGWVEQPLEICDVKMSMGISLRTMLKFCNVMFWTFPAGLTPTNTKFWKRGLESEQGLGSEPPFRAWFWPHNYRSPTQHHSTDRPQLLIIGNVKDCWNTNLPIQDVLCWFAAKP